MRIYNHDIMTCTHRQVEGNHLYSGRVLGMSTPGDVIQLHPSLQSDWQAITGHYRRVGLQTTRKVIWDLSLERLSDYPDHQPSVFYFGDTVQPNGLKDRYFQGLDLRWHQVVQFMNCKNNFMELADKLQVMVPQTHCFTDANQVNGSFSFPCYLKPSVSVDGMGIVYCQDHSQLKHAVEALPPKVGFQIQSEVLASSFLNLQYRIVAGVAEPLAASEQILEGCAHGGNRYPSLHQPWELVDPMAQWMAMQGMQDIFAFDVAVVAGQASPTYLAIECNPRFNGASYPTGVAHRLDIPCWSCETFRTDYRSLQSLDLLDLEYRPHSGSGIVLINWGPIQVGKLVILLAGSPKQQHQLRAAVQERLIGR